MEVGVLYLAGWFGMLVTSINYEYTEADGPRTVRFDLLDRMDQENGISAMMRTTGYSLAAVARLQGAGKIPLGVHTPDASVPLDGYLEALAERGVEVVRSS